VELLIEAGAEECRDMVHPTEAKEKKNNFILLPKSGRHETSGQRIESNHYRLNFVCSVCREENSLLLAVFA